MSNYLNQMRTTSPDLGIHTNFGSDGSGSCNLTNNPGSGSDGYHSRSPVQRFVPEGREVRRRCPKTLDDGPCGWFCLKLINFYFCMK